MATQKARNLAFDTTGITAGATGVQSAPVIHQNEPQQKVDASTENSVTIPLAYFLGLQLVCALLGFYYLTFWPAVLVVAASSALILYQALAGESFLLKTLAYAALTYGLTGAILSSDFGLLNATWESFLFCAFAVLLSVGFLASKEACRWLLGDCLLVTYESDDEAVLLDPQLAFSERKTLASSLKVGDIVRYYPEDLVFADGLVLSGVAEVEQRLASGQSRFCVKGKGDPIFAGSSIVGGMLDVKIELPPEASNFRRSVTLIKSEIAKLDAEISRTQSSPESLGGISPHVLLCFAGLVATVAWGILGQWGTGFWCGAATMSLSVLVAFVQRLKPILFRHLLISAFAKGILVNEFFRIYQAIFSADKIACLNIDTGSSDTAEVSVTKFEVTDDRVDEQVLRSVIISILGRSEAEVHLAIAQAIREQSDSIRLYEMTSAHAEPDNAGVTEAVEAVVEGITFRMGSEEWLISQGVMVQPNELCDLAPGQTPYLIAMGNEIVAVVSLQIPPDAQVHRMQALTSLVKSHQIRTVLISDAPEAEGVELAKRSGIELEDICFAQSEEVAINRLSHLSPVTLIAPSGTSPLVEAAASVVARPYQFYEHIQLKPMSFGFLNSSPSTVGWFILAIRKCQSLIDFQYISTKYAVVGLGLLSATGLLPAPVAVASATILGAFLFIRR